MRVSVSSCGSTYLWGRSALTPQTNVGRFQYPRVDRLICGAEILRRPEKPVWLFQYPRVDRLICGGHRPRVSTLAPASFSILVWIDLFVGIGLPKSLAAQMVFQYPRVDRLICGAQKARSASVASVAVSVSSCGSTYLWGDCLLRHLIWLASLTGLFTLLLEACRACILWPLFWFERVSVSCFADRFLLP